MQQIKLNDGNEIPILGFGTWKLEGQACLEMVRTALDAGYRHIDTAHRYNNHDMVAKAIERSDLEREDIFITTKIWRDSLEPTALKDQFMKALTELNTKYIDMILIHWPNRDVPIAETYSAMKELQDNNLALSIGVSNFTIHHLQDAIDAGFKPAVNQVEFHPSLYQKDLLEFCRDNDIQTEAYSPLAQGEDIDHEVINAIAGKYNVTPAQITIAWLVNKDIIALPRSSNKDHVRENIAALDIKLDTEDINTLDGLGEGNRLLTPEYADFEY